jgi:hypothetical protein
MGDETVDQERRIAGSKAEYDRLQFVTPAVGKLADFFGRQLADARGAK